MVQQLSQADSEDPNNRWTYVLWPDSYACCDTILLIKVWALSLGADSSHCIKVALVQSGSCD